MIVVLQLGVDTEFAPIVGQIGRKESVALLKEM